jgi:hypothetical protein
VRRNLLLVGAIAVLGGMFALLFADSGGDRRETPDQRGVPDPHVAAGTPQAPGAITDAASKRQEIARSGAAMPESGAAGAASGTSGDFLLLQVVLRETGAPVPGARVQVLAPTPESLADIERAFFAGTTLAALLEQFGTSRTADAEGRARIPRPTDLVLIAASKGDLYGVLEMNKVYESLDKEGVLRLELETEPALRIRVRDQNGRPVAGIPVALRVGDGDDFSSFDLMRVNTDAEGVGTLPQARAFSRVSSPSQDVGHYAAIAVVLLETVRVPLDLEKIPIEPVELVLPPTGAVRVRLQDSAGNPLREELLVALSRARDNPEDDDDWLAPGMPGFGASTEWGTNGEALFPFVGLGLAIHVSALYPGAPKATIVLARGPTQPGESIEVVLRETLDYPVLLVALRNAQDAPVSGRAVTALVMHSHADGTWDETFHLEADAEGRVRLPLLLGSESASLAIAWSVRDDIGAPPLIGRSDLARLPAPGENDLGVIRLVAAPLLAAGRVAGPDGAPIAGAQVTPSRRTIYGENQEDFFWESVGSLRTQTAADGGFTLYGPWNEPELQLEAEAEGWLSAALATRPGARDLEIRLGAAAALEGRIVADAGVDRDAIRVSLRYLNAPLTDDPDGNDATVGVDSDSGRFRFQPAPPGIADLTLEVANFRQDAEPLLVIPSVQVGGPPDARLDPVDLRGKLHGCRIRATGEGGVTLDYCEAWPVARPDWAVQGWQGRIGLISLEPLGEVTVTAPGWREVRFTPTAPDAEIVLPRGYEVRVATAAGAVLQGDKRLGCFLIPESGEDAWTRGTRMVFDNSGEALLLVSNVGVYRVEFFLTKASDDDVFDPFGWDFEWIPRADDEPVTRIRVEDSRRAQSFRAEAPAAQRIAEVAASSHEEAADGE